LKRSSTGNGKPLQIAVDSVPGTSGRPKPAIGDDQARTSGDQARNNVGQ
jgi:hypothetical protein